MNTLKTIWLSVIIIMSHVVKKRKGHLQVEIDPKIYAQLRNAAKKQGKKVDDLAREIFLKSIRKKKKG